MAIAHYNCHKCTNIYVGYLNGKPAIWCKPAVDEFDGGSSEYVAIVANHDKYDLQLENNNQLMLVG